ncbi:MAG: hypothetical protein JO307_29225 [Bryobacterales bacterium]|nr:hypothetical protein [Bryobacterales bacterium]MBV9398116.1 hypothetical protein [Bryobacterales bacterium]
MKPRVALLTILALPVAAQWIDYKAPGIPRLPDGKPDLSAPAPKTADGKPDLSGIWRGGGGRFDYDVAPGLKPDDIQPWAEKLRQERIGDFRKDSPLARCLPVSVSFHNSRDLSRIVQTPGLIVILYESPNSPHRTIFTDGRELPKDPSPTWLGYSVAHWDGDTLVVESTGFNDKGWLDVGGHPNSDALRITERYHRRDFGHMDLEMTLNDPKVFSKPVVMQMHKVLSPDTEILEDVCENERDRGHLESGIKLSPEVLAKYAGVYEYAPGQEVSVTISGGLLYLQEAANQAKVLYVPRTETTFLASVVNDDALEFMKNAQGSVTGLVRHVGGRDRKAVRKAGGL